VLDFHIGTILFQIIAFLVLMLIVSKFAMRPMLSTMQKRQDYIESEIDAAEKSRKSAEESVEEQRKALEEARNESYQIVERAKRQSEAEGNKILESARKQSERNLEEARKEILTEKEQAVAELREQVASLSVQIATKVIEKELDEKDQEKLINEYLEEVGESR
jgi:F-type H+-transporting ATPase subunit b